MIALVSGGVAGLCLSSFLVILQIPQRVMDIADAGSMRLYGLALTLGSLAAALMLALPESLPDAGWLTCLPGMLALLLGGMFVGALASALTEVLDVVPALFDRLGITGNMRLPALALLAGKTLGALLAGVMGL